MANTCRVIQVIGSPQVSLFIDSIIELARQRRLRRRGALALIIHISLTPTFPVPRRYPGSFFGHTKRYKAIEFVGYLARLAKRDRALAGHRGGPFYGVRADIGAAVDGDNAVAIGCGQHEGKLASDVAHENPPRRTETRAAETNHTPSAPHPRCL